MGLFDKIKGFIGDPEDEDDFEEEQEENMDFVSKATETPEQFAADNAKRSNKVVNHPRHCAAPGGARQAGAV